VSSDLTAHVFRSIARDRYRGSFGCDGSACSCLRRILFGRSSTKRSAPRHRPRPLPFGSRWRDTGDAGAVNEGGAGGLMPAEW